MKLRVRPNSIRFRLGPRDVQTLLVAGALSETLRFGPGDGQLLRYRLALVANTPALSARIEGSEIVVSLARSTAEGWANEEGLALEGEQPVGDGQTLQILVEKDLQCLETPAAPEEDVYPNPSANCGV